MIFIKKFKLGELNKLDYKDLILCVNISSMVRKIAFGLVRNVKSLELTKAEKFYGAVI